MPGAQASAHPGLGKRPSRHPGTARLLPAPPPAVISLTRSHLPSPAPQIFSRTREGFSLVEERQEMPSLKEVALEVLPRAAAAAARR